MSTKNERSPFGTYKFFWQKICFEKSFQNSFFLKNFKKTSQILKPISPEKRTFGNFKFLVPINPVNIFRQVFILINFLGKKSFSKLITVFKKFKNKIQILKPISPKKKAMIRIF